MEENTPEDIWANDKAVRAAILKINKENMASDKWVDEERKRRGMPILQRNRPMSPDEAKIHRILEKSQLEYTIRKEIKRGKKQQAKLDAAQQEKHARLLNTGLFEEE
jgi:hypothetical protein